MDYPALGGRKLHDSLFDRKVCWTSDSISFTREYKNLSEIQTSYHKQTPIASMTIIKKWQLNGAVLQGVCAATGTTGMVGEVATPVGAETCDEAGAIFAVGAELVLS